jgi:hypothetical protein
MSKARRNYRYRHPASLFSPPAIDPFYPHESGLEPLPLILLSAFGIATAANGLSLLTGAPFLIALMLALGFCGSKLYFLLRHEPRHEQTVDGRRDKVLAYLILAAILFVLSAYGLYGFGGAGAAAISAGKAAHSAAGLMGFLAATVSKGVYAIVCWIAAAITEAVIVIIVWRDHREYE